MQPDPALLNSLYGTKSKRTVFGNVRGSPTGGVQGFDVLTTADILHNSNPAHWLPAYCAHALSNFAEEYLSVLANPDTFVSLPTEVVDSLLRLDTSKAQE